MLHIRSRIILVLFCLFSSLPSSAKDIELRWYLASESVIGYADFLEDPESIYDFDAIKKPEQQAKFQPFLKTHINEGITKSAYWLKFTLYNPRENGVTWVVHTETSYIDNMDVWVKTDSAKWRHSKATDKLKFSTRSINYRFINTTARLKAKERATVYVRLSSNTLEPMNIHLYVSGQMNLRDILAKEYLFYGIYYGLFIALALLTLSVWVYAQADTLKYYVYFSCYLIASLFMWTSLNGFSFQFLWPTSGWFHNQSFHIIYLCVATFSFLFSREMLNTREVLPTIDKFILLLVFVYVISIIVRLFGLYEPIVYIALFSLLSMSIQPVLGWLCYRKGNTYLVFFIIAWVPYSVSLSLSIISIMTGWFAFNMSTLLISQFAFLFECLMLILATLGKMRHRSEKLSQLSLLDPLTELGNRRRLELYIASLVADTHREGEFWLLLIDIDHFKKINDTLGHSAGDEVLVTLSSLLKKVCRSSDVAIRWGGEEFIVLINVDSEITAYRVAERIRRCFNENPLEFNNESNTYSLSIGLHQLDFEGHDPLGVAVELADQALYRAKTTGRNKTIIYNEDLDTIQL